MQRSRSPQSAWIQCSKDGIACSTELCFCSRHCRVVEQQAQSGNGVISSGAGTNTYFIHSNSHRAAWFLEWKYGFADVSTRTGSATEQSLCTLCSASLPNAFLRARKDTTTHARMQARRVFHDRHCLTVSGRSIVTIALASNRFPIRRSPGVFRSCFMQMIY